MKLRYAIISVTLLAAVAVSQDTTKSVWDGVFTTDKAKRGEAAYNTNCASCHGDQLNGGEMAPPLAGGEFMSNWNGLTVGQLFDRIRTGMPPGTPNKVGHEAKVDIVAYILSYNKFPAGDKELPQQAAMMNVIKIESEKPKK